MSLFMTHRIRVIPTLINAPHRAGLTGFLCLLWAGSKEGRSFRDVNIKAIYQKILHATPQSFALQLNDFGGTRPSYYIHRDDDFFFYKLLEVLDHSMSLGLHFEAQELVKNALPDLPSSNSSFWKQWRGLLTLIETLIPILKRHNNSALDDASGRFIKPALCTAAHALIDSRPIEPKDWNRTSGKREKCHCAPCISLSQFLANPRESVGRFRYSKKTRDHLQYSLNTQDFIFDTERNGTPHTLMVRKTNNEYSGLSNEWRHSVNEMKSRIKRAYNDFLKVLLGDDFAAALPELIREGLDLGASAPLQPVPASTQNRRGGTRSVAGVKRKSEVVDLTEDASD